MSPVLQVRDLKKAYGVIQAVGGVSFDVMPGEIFGVIGPNGSGKSTMFNSVLGQIKPDSGQISLKGKDISARCARAASCSTAPTSPVPRRASCSTGASASCRRDAICSAS